MARPAPKKLSTAPVLSSSRTPPAPDSRQVRFQKDGEAPQVAANLEPGIVQHKPTKPTRHRVPEPQRLRVMQKYAAGESIVQISREENRNRETVTKIVRSSEMQDFVRQMREEFYGLAFEAVDALRHALQAQKDGRLAYQLLRDIGVILSPEERAQAAMQQSAQGDAPLTPYEHAVLGLARCAQERSEVYGTSLPTPAEMEHNLKVSEEINRATGGKGQELSLSNPAEWNRLKALVEERLKKEGKK